MSQSYNKSCIFCKDEIVMSDRSTGKWMPYDLNGRVHECKTTSTRHKHRNQEGNKLPNG